MCKNGIIKGFAELSSVLGDDGYREKERFHTDVFKANGYERAEVKQSMRKSEDARK